MVASCWVVPTVSGSSRLRQDTTRATVEEALRQAADRAESEHDERAGRQRRYLERLSSRADLAVLASEEMWR